MSVSFIVEMKYLILTESLDLFCKIRKSFLQKKMTFRFGL